MLDKKDLHEVNSLMQKNLEDFYEKFLVPYFDHNEKEHKLTRGSVKEQVEELKEYVKDHEKRIRKLEIITQSS